MKKGPDTFSFQTDIVAVRGVTSDEMMTEIAARVWGKVSNRSQRIKGIVFERQGKLYWFPRPKE
jgi:hypothetical protein